MTFGEKMEKRRLEMGLSQTDLAEAVGTKQPQIARWAASPSPPKWEFMLRIARTLKVSVDYMIDPALDAPPDARPAEPDLSYAERVILDVVRAKGIDHHTAIRRLLPPAGYEAVPATGSQDRSEGQTG